MQVMRRVPVSVLLPVHALTSRVANDASDDDAHLHSLPPSSSSSLHIWQLARERRQRLPMIVSVLVSVVNFQ